MEKITNPFIRYNWSIFTEDPSSWDKNGRIQAKSKLLFQDYRFGLINLQNVKKDGDEESGKLKTNLVTIKQELLTEGQEVLEINHSFSHPIITIGRLEANHVSISNNLVSRRHCVIVNYPNDVWLYDLGSTTGTLVDGKKLSGKIYLDSVHEVKIGKSEAIKISSKKGLLS